MNHGSRLVSLSRWFSIQDLVGTVIAEAQGFILYLSIHPYLFVTIYSS